MSLIRICQKFQVQNFTCPKLFTITLYNPTISAFCKFYIFHKPHKLLGQPLATYICFGENNPLHYTQLGLPPSQIVTHQLGLPLEYFLKILNGSKEWNKPPEIFCPIAQFDTSYHPILQDCHHTHTHY